MGAQGLVVRGLENGNHVVRPHRPVGLLELGPMLLREPGALVGPLHGFLDVLYPSSVQFTSTTYVGIIVLLVSRRPGRSNSPVRLHDARRTSRTHTPGCLRLWALRLPVGEDGSCSAEHPEPT